MKNKIKKFFLDFDGTVVSFQFPYIGKANENAIETLKKIQNKGHEIILNTKRCEAEFDNGTYDEAVKYLTDNGINLSSERLYVKIYPSKWDVNTLESSDVIYIDDIAKDCPLISEVNAVGNNTNIMVDWEQIHNDLESKNII